MDNLETVWKTAVSVNNVALKEACISAMCVDPPRLVTLDLLRESMSVENLREILRSLETHGWGGEMQLFTVAHWMDAGERVGVLNDRVEQLEDLLTFIKPSDITPTKMVEILGSDFVMVEGKRNR